MIEIKNSSDLPQEAQPAASVEPVAWARRHPDGALTAEFIEHDAIEDVRKRSGAWVPLYRAPVATQPDDQLSSILQRLRHHSEDKRNTAFSRSTMKETIQYIEDKFRRNHE